MKKGLFSSFIFALILILAACGGGDKGKDEGNANEGGASDSAATVDLKATNWAFDQETYTVPAGKVTVNLKNEEGFHGIQIEGTDINIEGDGSDTATLEPGEYKIFCSIVCGTGHADMIATLIVE